MENQNYSIKTFKGENEYLTMVDCQKIVGVHFGQGPVFMRLNEVSPFIDGYFLNIGDEYNRTGFYSKDEKSAKAGAAAMQKIIEDHIIFSELYGGK
jgi:hypothetical protein